MECGQLKLNMEENLVNIGDIQKNVYAFPIFKNELIVLFIIITLIV